MFKQYVNNEQFNLQINRFFNDFYQDDERANQDLQAIIPRLTDTDSWYNTWIEYAAMREHQKDLIRFGLLSGCRVLYGIIRSKKRKSVPKIP